MFTSKPVKPLFSKRRKIVDHPQLCSVGAEIYLNTTLGKINSLGEERSGFFFPSNSATRVFKANLFNPHIGTQVYWKSRTFTLNFGLRFGAVYYYQGEAFGNYSNSSFELANRLIDDTPFILTQYDIQLAKGNDRIQNFIQVTWNEDFADFLNPQASFSFGLKANLPSLVRSLKRINK